MFSLLGCTQTLLAAVLALVFAAGAGAVAAAGVAGLTRAPINVHFI